jgi:uncharacterized protein
LDPSKDKPRFPASGTASSSNEAASREPAASDIAAYLRSHPDFLIEHPDLFAVLTPPAVQHGDNILDLQYFMVQRLRTDLARLKGQQRALIATSRSNLSSQNRIHAAVLALIAATSFQHLLQLVTTDLAVLLDVDIITIGIESSSGSQPRLPLPGIRLLRTGTVDRLLGPERQAALHGDILGDPGLFGAAAGLVRSEALLRLAVSEESPAGLLCIGTRRPDRFHPGQGTELLCFLARALETSIAGWLNLAA